MEPLVRIRPPGPTAREILRRDAEVISPSLSRAYPLVIDRAAGVNLWDVDGNRYLDFTAGIAVMNVGWNHPEVVRAVQEQTERLSHTVFADFCSELPVRFAEELVKFLPAGLDTVYFGNSGAESVEAAMKLARYHTGRKYFLAFHRAFHGRTFGALTLTAGRTKQRKHFGPFLSAVHAPYPDPYRPLCRNSRASCDQDVLDYIEDVIFRTEVSPEEVAAIVVEPVLGEGGYVVPPRTFLKRLRSLCDEHGILLVDDEVQAGGYRTGKFLAAEHSGVTADIVCLAKPIGGGLPIGVTVSTGEIMDWPPGSHASTFGGNAISCAAGLAVLEIMRAPTFGAHVLAQGEHLVEGLERLRRVHEGIGDVRSLGLMAGMELVRKRETREPDAEMRDRIVRECFERGLALLPAGESAIRFSPPLVIEKDDIDAGLSILDGVLSRICGR
ncbi:MAG: acetyl ornithine aminotransferase family protein [Methanomicrobiales archaeon]|nr:acetyl ornithine aminotransferase family protein [Methanomicrobiales archaeon]MDI6876384.1 acetyl ornithine aminotransferase family protein [Methanomicrobiales archaeon]